MVNRAGQVRWSSSTWEPLRDEAGRQIGFLGTEFDITERKLAEEAMRLDTELFQAVIEVQQVGGRRGARFGDRALRHRRAEPAAHRAPPAPSSRRSRATSWSPRCTSGPRHPGSGSSNSLSGLCVRTGELQRSDDLTTDPRVGHNAYTALGVRSLLAVPLKDEQRTLGVLKVVSTSPRAFTDRDAKALRLLGGLMGAALSHAAAFESRQARLEERTQALQESEQRFKQLVDVAQEGIWVADDRGVITYVNQRMTELLGYPSGSLLGRPIYEFIDGGSRAAAQRMLARPDAARESHDIIASAARTAASSGSWCRPVRSRREEGAKVGTVGMVTDITERKRAEERLRRVGRATGDAARHGSGDPRRQVARRSRPRGAVPDPPDGALPAVLRSCSTISSGTRRSCSPAMPVSSS